MLRIISKLYIVGRNFKTKRIINGFAKRNIKKIKNKKFTYCKNIWSKNYLWDYFLQSLPDSEKSKYYVPGDYYALEIEPRLNNKFTCFGMEKNMYEKTFSDSAAKFPETFLRCMNGIYLDRNYVLVNDVRSHCMRIREDIIVKPSVETGCGENVRKYFYAKNTLCYEESHKFDIKEITDVYQGNFIIQGIVKQNAAIAKFHSHSLNTVRCFSYRSIKTNQVHVTMAVLRMGVNKSHVDTFSTGGIACGIKKDGSLMKYAFDRFANYYTHHPSTKMRFENFNVPSFDKVIRVIKTLANSIPHQRVAGWDFGIDAEGEPVLIEVNVSTGSWLMQISCGRPLFGDYSQEVKEYIDSLK